MSHYSRSFFVCLVILFSLTFLPKTFVEASVAAVVTSPFSYNFSSDGTVLEKNKNASSTSPYWWVSSGAKMIITQGMGQTLHGALPLIDSFAKLYLVSNPIDTDGGIHPQNIFRLVGRSPWHNLRQEAYFKIDANNLSTSANRNASNGLFFFNRYQNESNLYYTGLRVDGFAVIKKKVNGVYTTLSYTRMLPGTYNTLTNPNLLPSNTWIGMRSEVTTASGVVTIKVYSDIGKTGTWKLVAQATDNGASNGAIIDNSGFGGIRTDFMDVSFDFYNITEI